jgi:hypothetical protein
MAKNRAVNPQHYLASMNLEDAKKFQTEYYKNLGDKTEAKAGLAIKNKLLRELKKTPKYKAWAKSRKGKNKDTRVPTTNFDKDGNRIYKGDNTQAVYDSYDTTPDARRAANSTDPWDRKNRGVAATAADRWAWQNRNTMAKAAEFKAIGMDAAFADEGKILRNLGGDSEKSLINPFGEASTDYFDYSNLASVNSYGNWKSTNGEAVNLRDKYKYYNQLKYGERPEEGAEKWAKYNFDELDKAGIFTARRKGEASYQSRLDAYKGGILDEQPTKAEASIIANPYEASQSTLESPYNTAATRSTSAGQSGIIGNTKAGDKVYNPKTAVRNKIEQRMVAKRKAKQDTILTRSKERIQ